MATGLFGGVRWAGLEGVDDTEAGVSDTEFVLLLGIYLLGLLGVAVNHCFVLLCVAVEDLHQVLVSSCQVPQYCYCFGHLGPCLYPTGSLV